MSLEEFVLLTKDKSPEARGEVSDFVDESNIYELEEPSESETLGFYSKRGELFGYIVYSIHNAMCERGYLKLEFARSFYPHKGVFRELFSHLKEIAEGNECKSIVLQVFENDTRPRAIYEKYGFRYTGNDIPPDDECPNTILEMALPLRR